MSQWVMRVNTSKTKAMVKPGSLTTVPAFQHLNFSDVRLPFERELKILGVKFD